MEGGEYPHRRQGGWAGQSHTTKINTERIKRKTRNSMIHRNMAPGALGGLPSMSGLVAGGGQPLVRTWGLRLAQQQAFCSAHPGTCIAEVPTRPTARHRHSRTLSTRHPSPFLPHNQSPFSAPENPQQPISCPQGTDGGVTSCWSSKSLTEVLSSVRREMTRICFTVERGIRDI